MTADERALGALDRMMAMPPPGAPIDPLRFCRLQNLVADTIREAVADEREACARLVEDREACAQVVGCGRGAPHVGWFSWYFAGQIRARGQPVSPESLPEGGA